jgi:hypothetical protein
MKLAGFTIESVCRCVGAVVALAATTGVPRVARGWALAGEGVAVLAGVTGVERDPTGRHWSSSAPALLTRNPSDRLRMLFQTPRMARLSNRLRYQTPRNAVSEGETTERS